MAVLAQHTKEFTLNGPAYCEAQQGKLAYGKLRTDRVDLYSILSEKSSEHVEYSKPKTVAADLACGNWDKGLVFLVMDCQDSANVWDCLGNGKGQALSSIHVSLPGKNQTARLTSPETDAQILSSPQRPPQAPLGDNGPWALIDREGHRHLTFGRLHSTPEMFTNPKMAEDLRTGGFDVLYYKSLDGDPLKNPEYEIDFSAWLPRPAAHSTVLSSQLLDDPERHGKLRLAVFGMFRTPNPSTGYDEDVYNGIVTSSINPQALTKNSQKRIVLDPEKTHGVLSTAQLTCKIWDKYGIAPDGNVNVYIPFFPNFLDPKDGRHFITFSTTKGLFGKWENGKITQPNGSILSEAEVRTMICGSQ